ncbi:MAG: hypothetical protein Q9M36_10815 [Sulfurovum sp.]|nr:hypothetical protein [Sulfurovum sp.]
MHKNNKNNMFSWIVMAMIVMIPLELRAKVVMPQVTSLKKITHEHTQTTVSICAVMQHYSYKKVASSTLKSNIKVLPKATFMPSWSYNTLCLKGLNPHTQYQVTLHKGMHVGKNILDKTYTFTATTLDYKPSVTFGEEGYILPTKGDISIPIETTNVKKLSFSLYRINSRNLIHSVNRYGLFRTLSEYSFEDIEEQSGYLLWKKSMNISSSVANESKVTAVPVGEFLHKREAGVYILYAQMLDDKGKEIYDYNTKMQWFMVSDIGLYTLQSTKGMEVFTHTLSSAKPYNDVN